LLAERPTVSAKFSTGSINVTPNALAQLTHDDIMAALGRHVLGDWGELDEEDRQANERALLDDTRLVSRYRAANGTKFYIITEHDRSLTTVLLPEDY
jgi:hypothetical protein